MSDDGMLEEVRAWLQRNGYVLEMEVARAVAQHATWVWQGAHYTDPVTDKLRETDVWALWIDQARSDTSHSLSVFFECKSTTAPWILFEGNTEPDYTVPVANLSGDCAICQRLEIAISNMVRDWGPDAYAAVQKRDPLAKSVDHAREGVHQAVSAAVGMTGGTSVTQGHSKDRTLTTLALPVVVTRSPLVVCSLNEQGEVELRPTDRAVMEVPIKTSGDHYDNFSVFVMSLPALGDFLDGISSLSPLLESQQEDAAGDSTA